jgi:hypothetical protein
MDNFFKFDNPNGKVKEIWRPYTDENQQFMVFKPCDPGDARQGMGLPADPQQIGMVKRNLGR